MYAYKVAFGNGWAESHTTKISVTRASISEPYLLLMIDLDTEKVAELAARVFSHGLPQARNSRSLHVGNANAHHRCGDETARADDPADRHRIARTLARDEILIRVLRSTIGSRVAQNRKERFERA